MVNENLAKQVQNREIHGSRINYRESNPKEILNKTIPAQP